MSENPLEVTLKNARQACRFLWQFNRSILDIVDIIEDDFPSHEFYWWRPTDDSGFYMGRIAPNEKPVLTSLPLFNFSLLYLPTGRSHANAEIEQWMLEICVTLDDGFPGEKSADSRPNEFTLPENSSSWISLLAWKYSKKTIDQLNWYRDIWGKIDYPEDKGMKKDLNGCISVSNIEFELHNLGSREDVQGAVRQAKNQFNKHLGLGLNLGGT